MMAKVKKPSSKECPEDWRDTIINQLFSNIDQEGCEYAAVGLDMAAQEKNWGLSLITMDKSCLKGKLHLILPHYAALKGTTGHFVVEPSIDYLRDILASLRSRKIVTAIAVDVPLGWPKWHGEFTKNWSATKTTTTALLSRSGFERRLTDRELKKKLDKTLLAVGADKIASAAYEWAIKRVALADLIDCCDVGLGVVGNPLLTLFETYPGGYVKLNYETCVQYKTGEQKSKKRPTPRTTEAIRYTLLDNIRKDYDLDSHDCESQINQACCVNESDAFDGFLSALTAWDYLRWRVYGDCSHLTTTPEKILSRKLNPEEIALIESEGWILTRMSPFTVTNQPNSSSIKVPHAQG